MPANLNTHANEDIKDASNPEQSLGSNPFVQWTLFLALPGYIALLTIKNARAGNDAFHFLSKLLFGTNWGTTAMMALLCLALFPPLVTWAKNSPHKQKAQIAFAGVLITTAIAAFLTA